MEDLTQLEILSEDSILTAIRDRYQNGQIYTNCGDLLIAVNPYTDIALYTHQHHEEYSWQKISQLPAPHVYYTAARAYRRMRESETDQVVLVSGESGAGKTESTKHMVKHLIHMCPHESGDLHDRIIQVNPLLEAFGNAETIMNHNSSRFAKYLELTFRQDGHVVGANVKDYMLEKSRVVIRDSKEANFHIFYCFFAGAERSVLEGLEIKAVDTYRIMQGQALRSKDMEQYRNQYQQCVDVLRHVGLDDLDIDSIHLILGAILHLTEVKFKESDDHNKPLGITNPDHLIKVAELLDISVEKLGVALVSRESKIKDEQVKKLYTMAEAEDSRDSMAKSLYERLFGWVVKKINDDLHPNRERFNQNTLSIGILDIAGFEKLEHNSLEQLLINIVNERLQNFTNKSIIEYEQIIYKDEGIVADNIVFQNNEAILELFLQKTGLLALLDEETKLRTGTDKTFMTKIGEKFFTDSHFTRPPREPGVFGIMHFAGQVWYHSEGFLEKNRDRMPVDLDKCLQDSENQFIVDLFQAKKGKTGTISATTYNIRQSQRNILGMIHGQQSASKQKKMEDLNKSIKKRLGIQETTFKTYTPQRQDTVVSYFKTSLDELVQKMRKAVPYFVRCIKPNDFQQPSQFDVERVRDQLKYNGISQVAEIRKQGFPIRKEYLEFVLRYRPLVGNLQETNAEAATEKILSQVLPPQFRAKYKKGKTKIFMSEDINIWLERCYAHRRKSAAWSIWKYYLGYREKKRKQEQEEEERRRRQQMEREKERGEEEEPSASTSGFPDMSNTSNLGHSFRGANSFGNSFSGNDDDDDDDDDDTQSRVSFGSLRDTRVLHNLGDSNRSWGEDSDTSVQDVNPVTMTKPTPTASSPPPSSQETESNKTPFWDIFQVIRRDNKYVDVDRQRYLQILKCVIYILLLLILLLCNICQKISLMTLVADQSPLFEIESGVSQKLVKNARYILGMIAVVVPYCLIVLISLWRSLFGGLGLPSVKTILLVSLIECAHGVGLSILVLKILPQLDGIRGIMLLNVAAIVPGILKCVCSHRNNIRGTCHSILGRITEFIADVLATLVQIAAVPLILLLGYFDVSRAENESQFVDDSSNIVYLCVGLVLCSVSWWENFLDIKYSLGKTMQRESTFLTLKFELQEMRPVVFLFSTLLKIGTVILVGYLLKEPDMTFNLSEIVETLERQSADIKFNTSIVVLTVASVVGYYTAYTACKLQMQKMSFSLPLMLSTPLAAVLVYLDCRYEFLEAVSKENRDCLIDFSDNWFHLLLGVAWWASLYWLGRHVWFPNQKRLERVDVLFVNQLYCDILLEQHLLLNRRRHAHKLIKIKEDNITHYRLKQLQSQKDTDGGWRNSRYEELQNDSQEGSEESTRKTEKTIPPMIYACATLWHENRLEMLQILKSLFRMDKDYNMRRLAVENGESISDVEYYEFEPHIFFDDAFEKDEEEEFVVNDFVKLFLSVINEAASCVYEKPVEIDPPFYVPSPYGGQVIFLMPGTSLMYVHLKNKSKIRNKKRWSQVMYMYYLLGYRIIQECNAKVAHAVETNQFNSLISWGNSGLTGEPHRSQIFQFLDAEVIARAENTFLLALDGDVDFTPGAVRLLVDKMHKNPRVGASCGRIHPIGSGPMVWYQKFEYAIAHWLQKSTEHVLGCVLCSPGCFSLFRGSALMDDNVMKKYTALPTTPVHHLMYDQGEDRWLCTLLLQQGYRVDYAAASDAFTYAPEGFNEFFNQRRRWMPSTLANVMDLLNDANNTVRVNNNISWLYIVYQAALMVSTLIGPSTMLMMIAGAIQAVFNLSLINSYLASCLPAAIFFLACFWIEAKYQLMAAQVLSAIYIFIMMVVFVGVLITAFTENPFHPSVIFLAALFFIFFVSACFHPKEFSCIMFGALYFVAIPMGFLYLVIYSFVNMNIISWGTREVAKKKTKKELEEEEKKKQEAAEKKKQNSFLSRFLPGSQIKEVLKAAKEFQASTRQNDESATVLKEINSNLKNLMTMISQGQGQKGQGQGQQGQADEGRSEGQSAPGPARKGIIKNVKFQDISETKIIVEEEAEEEDEEEAVKPRKPKIKRDDLKNPYWLDAEEFSSGEVIKMLDEEKNFWEKFISKYEYPLDYSKEEKEETRKQLAELRTNTCTGFVIINLMWLAINFMFQYKQPANVSIPLPAGYDSDLDEVRFDLIEIDILGLAFVIFFIGVLFIQFAGMLMHRWGTVTHLLAITEIDNPFSSKGPATNNFQNLTPEERDRVKLRHWQELNDEPDPDYPASDEEEEIGYKMDLRRSMKDKIQNNARFGTIDDPNAAPDMRKSLRTSTMGHSLGYSSALQQSVGRCTDLGKTLERVQNATAMGTVRYRNNALAKTAPISMGQEQSKIGHNQAYYRNFLQTLKEKNIGERYGLLHQPTDLGRTMRRGANNIPEDEGVEAEQRVLEEIEPVYEKMSKLGTAGRAYARKYKYLKLQEYNLSKSQGGGRRTGRNSIYNAHLN